jgi:methionyl-tRNA synthetase
MQTSYTQTAEDRGSEEDAKENPKEDDKSKLDACISHLTRALYIAGVLLKPVLVTKADLLLDQLGVSSRNYEDVKNAHILDGVKVDKKDQLFPRLDITVEVAKIVELIKAK